MFYGGNTGKPETVKKGDKASTLSPVLLPESKPEVKQLSYNLNKLARAVAMHETHDCQDKQGAALVNNCFGIIRNGRFVRYATKEDSYADFKQIWTKYYGRFPDLELAKRYSGNDRSRTWLNNVIKFYNS